MEDRNSNPSEQVVAHAGRQGRILLVDEDRKVLDDYLPILRARGFEVRACLSYAQGAQCLDDEEFDFVIVDQGSLAFEGQAVVQRALQIDRWKPVLVLARCHDMKCYLEAMQLGALDYLEKPVPGSDIVRFVEMHARWHVAAA